MPFPYFDDRSHAGRVLAGRLADLSSDDVVVLALPRGGVPVAVEIARHVDADLDVLVVHKIGVPGHEELAMGAVGADGKLVVNHHVAAAAGIGMRWLQARAEAMSAELAQWAADLRQGRPPQPIGGRVAVVVDDGIATGASLRAALNVVRSAQPDRLVAAVPVAPPEARPEILLTADRLETLYEPEPFLAVGHWYRDFTQLTDDEVQEMLWSVPERHRTG